MARLLPKAEWLAWALFGLVLPFTSVPILLRVAGSGMVAPLAGPLAALLLLVSTFPAIIRRQPLPRVLFPLAAFIAAALLSTLAALFSDPPPFRTLSPLGTGSKAFLTLLFGLLFYLTVLSWAQTLRSARHLVRWINFGGMLMLLWCLLQAFYGRGGQMFPHWMEQINAWIAPHELYRGRLSGMAFEPSWLAHQLNMLYLPLWLGSALSGQTAHRLRLGFLTLERLLLLGGLAALVLSLSRVGLIAALVYLVIAAAYGAISLARRMHDRILRARRSVGSRRNWLGAGVYVLIGLVFFAASAGLFYAAARGFMRFDPRMARLFDFSLIRSGSFAAYANQLVFAERVVYWEAAWGVFNERPLLGIGLGNAGYYIQHQLSAYAWGLHEVRSLLFRSDTLLNPKSLWLRLLSETGVAGTGFYLAWLFTCAASALSLMRRSGWPRAIGWMGIFVLVGLVSEGMSIDSFALPYLWVSFALVGGLAAARQVNPHDSRS